MDFNKALNYAILNKENQTKQQETQSEIPNRDLSNHSLIILALL